MILPRLALFAAPTLLAAWLIEPATGYACGGYQCRNDQFLPRSGTVPANIPAIAWLPGFDTRSGASSELALPSFECAAADGSKHTIRFEAAPIDKPDRLQLSEKLIAGEHCTIQSGISDCSIDDPDYVAPISEGNEISYLAGRAEFDVVDDSPPPQSLGLSAVISARLGDVDVAADASCSENVEVCLAETSLDWSSEALPWQHALLLETYVDGAHFSTGRNLSVPDELGGLYYGRDRDAVYATLGTVADNVQLSKQLDLGEHTLEIKARLPGTNETLSTAPVIIVLRCTDNSPTPLAESNVAGESSGCSVGAGLGSSERRASWMLFGVVGLLLAAAKRRRR